ncbi:32401_t:CDS:10 [Gigaspora margarita]|uniref:32401_t:CDS:1 n=1 Tax=Gigaspora margarita TaxID=4874 RepID=A0ABN7UP89_GIGMA|nr:32401_t:CDS:10 [Gigaspora margarita]
MATVKPINTTSIHRICSSQVILDLTSAVKELVENGLDAQAKTIEIRFKEYGIQSIEVIDDGTGIDQHNFEQLALKHSTSKLSSFEDLIKLDSFGFRGEALSSLCALSKVMILTCTQEEAPAGFKLEFDSLGKLIKKTSIARERGTTVILQGLFESIPVRHQEFKKNIKREFGKTLTLLQSYAIICQNLKITCSNQLNKGARTVVLSTNGNSNIRDNIANLFGAKTLTQIMLFDFNIQVTPAKHKISVDSENQSESDVYPIHIIGYISKPIKGFGRGSSDRQFYFINSRPCILPKVAKTINELYKSFNTNQYPFCVVDFRLEKCYYDVNVTPDKRTIFIHDENVILEQLKNEMNNVFEPFRSTFTCLNTEVIKLSTKENDPNEIKSINVSREVTKFYQVESLPSGYSDSLKVENAKNGESHEENDPNEIKSINVCHEITKFYQAESLPSGYNDSLKVENTKNEESHEENGPNEVKSINVGQVELLPSDYGDSLKFVNIKNGESHVPKKVKILQSPLKEQELNRVIKKDDFAIMEIVGQSPLKEQELNRVIKKDDFAMMEIVGQFNLGFIIAKLYKDEGCDLFIIDQHASDEKYNFEQLQLNTKIDSQRLIRYLELTAAQELVAIDNIDILKANGFELEVDLEAQTTKKLKLISQPMSKDIIFGVEDLEELIFLLTERPGEMIRCSKVRKMFASRACRKSIMVGDALSYQQMEKIVRHMGEIDQPWNCPHGRPTMRHLFDLSQIPTYPSYSMRQRTNRGRLDNL